MKKYWTFYVVCVFLLISCNKELLEAPREKGESYFKPYESTIIFNEESKDIVSTVDSLTITLTGSNVQTDAIEIGDIVLSGPVKGAPAGFLRKVVNIENQNGTTILTTEYANLPDAFSEFRWNINADVKGGKERTEAEVQTETYDTTFSFDVGEINGAEVKLEITLTFEYQVQLVSFVEYSFSEGVTNASFGFDELKLTQLSFDKRFLLDGNAMEGVAPFSEIESFFDQEFISLELSPIPIGPPMVPVYVRPVIQLSGISEVMTSAEYYNTINFYNNGAGKGLLNYNNGIYSIEKELPSDFNVGVNVGVTGEISLETGLRLEVGLAPYTRSLFTTGIGLENSLINRLSGEFDVEFTSAAGATISAGAEYAIDYRTSGDIYIDGEFFGFIPDELDAKATVYDAQFNLFNVGFDYVNCFTTFEGVTAVADCESNDDYTLYFDAVTKNQIFQNGDRYKLELASDNGRTTLGSNYEFFTSYGELLSDFTPGNDTLIFTHMVNVDGILEERECIRQLSISFPDCSGTGSNPCEPWEVAELYSQPYCIYEDPINLAQWIASNLIYHQENEYKCYNDRPENCELYGSLYDYEDAVNVCPDGWRLPTMQEWDALLINYSDDIDTVDNKIYYRNAAIELRDPNNWSEDGITIPNLPIFNVLPAGYQSPDGNYNHKGEFGYFWTSTESQDGVNAYGVIFAKETDDVIISANVKENKFSCRCIKEN